MIDGVLVVDKPAGLTSHDVVMAARRSLGESRIGHTGTLDPLATGVLPLACGRATRLVRFLSASEKDYEATIRIGLATDTYDITGRETLRSDQRVSRDEIASALAALTGEYLQTPPAFSAKKIGGRRAHELARLDEAVQTTPVPVRVERLQLVDVTADIATITLTCSAGFYVRTLANDLGLRLGIGACLASLRRTRSGQFKLEGAASLDVVVRDPAAAASTLIPMEGLLGDLPAARLTEEGYRFVSHGRVVGREQLSGLVPETSEWVRLLSRDNLLVAVARRVEPPGFLHPSVVLI